MKQNVVICYAIIVTFAILSLSACISIPQANRDVKVPYDWAEYKFNNEVFSLKVPPTVELRGENDAYTHIQYSIGVDTHTGENYAVFQQKGLAFNLNSAKKKYARILLRFYTDNIGDYPKRNDREGVFFTNQDVYEIIDREAYPSNSTYDIDYGYQEVNGNQCFVISYTRSGLFGAPPVKCKICNFFNDCYFVQIIYSYREEESNIWAADFEKSLQTFRWLK